MRVDVPLAIQLEHANARRAAEARRVEDRAAHRRMQAQRSDLGTTRRVHIAPHGEGTIVTLTAPTQGLLLLRWYGLALAMLALGFGFEFAGPGQLIAASAGVLMSALGWYPWPFRIRIEGRAYALLGRRGRVRYVGRIYELYFRPKGKGVFDTSTDRRRDFYGIRHPADVSALLGLQAELDRIRDRDRDAW